MSGTLLKSLPRLLCSIILEHQRFPISSQVNRNIAAAMFLSTCLCSWRQLAQFKANEATKSINSVSPGPHDAIPWEFFSNDSQVGVILQVLPKCCVASVQAERKEVDYKCSDNTSNTRTNTSKLHSTILLATSLGPSKLCSHYLYCNNLSA